MIILISASQVARITSVSHEYLAGSNFGGSCTKFTIQIYINVMKRKEKKNQASYKPYIILKGFDFKSFPELQKNPTIQ
jgi:hypothetical protein